MNARTLACLALVACLSLTSVTLLVQGCLAGEQSADPFDQAEFLGSSLKSTGNMPGRFSSIGSYLYAAANVIIHSDDPHINHTYLKFSFASSPTWRQYFDEIAKQTGSKYSYDTKSGYWIFSSDPKASASEPSVENLLSDPKRDAAQSYTVTVASGWTSTDRGWYVSYRPPMEPVGMDVYLMGRYTSTGEKELKGLMENLSLDSARHIKVDASLSEMQSTSVDGVNALYYECPTPRPGVRWRQWVFLKDGLAYKIVSALPTANDKLASEVKAMVASFKAR